MKKVVIILVCLGTLFGFSLGVFAGDTINQTISALLMTSVKYNIDGTNRELGEEYGTIMYKDHIYVPIRFVAENTGGVVAYEQESGTVYMKSKGTLEINSEGDGVSLGNLIMTKEADQTRVSGVLDMPYTDNLESTINFFDKNGIKIGFVVIKGYFHEGMNNFEAVGQGDLRQYASTKYEIWRLGKHYRTPK
ncbi:stalk domain-containing protein [Paenibacillus tyrfis]|uniref:Copper amine oxidase-like N-terminal domain-containing protein n=1 Tax=Paenibacillus tyrfis TaxID=1501230 RepID=A0A081P2C1_9BACL|nr:stalk domain-containing protein [Paenibacillus tyrfis]KEQ24844.1 hypothetical protein ET33_07185 [Paenibacillus tyrfis]